MNFISNNLCFHFCQCLIQLRKVALWEFIWHECYSFYKFIYSWANFINFHQLVLWTTNCRLQCYCSNRLTFKNVTVKQITFCNFSLHFAFFSAGYECGVLKSLSLVLIHLIHFGIVHRSRQFSPYQSWICRSCVTDSVYFDFVCTIEFSIKFKTMCQLLQTSSIPEIFCMVPVINSLCHFCNYSW